MRPVLIFGLVLMALATIAFVIQDFSIPSYTKVVDTPTLQASTRQDHFFKVPLLVDAMLFLGGLAMVIFGAGTKETN